METSNTFDKGKSKIEKMKQRCGRIKSNTNTLSCTNQFINKNDKLRCTDSSFPYCIGKQYKEN